MIKKVWLDRCAKRYVERGGLREELAIQAAHACFENDPEMGPEEAADDDMEYWYEWDDRE